MEDSHSERVTEKDRRMGCCCTHKGQQRNQYPTVVISRCVLWTSSIYITWHDTNANSSTLEESETESETQRWAQCLVLTNKWFQCTLDILMGPSELIQTNPPSDSDAPTHLTFLLTPDQVSVPLPKLFPMLLLLKENLIPFLIISLNPTSIKFMNTVLDQNCSCQNHQRTHFAKSKGFFSHCLTWVIHTIWHNWPNFLLEALPPLGCLLPYWSVFSIRSPLYVPLVSCSAQSLDLTPPFYPPTATSSGMSLSFMVLNTIYLLSIPKLWSLYMTFRWTSDFHFHLDV